MAGKTVVVGIKNLEKCINKFKSVGDIDLTPVISKATRIVQRDAKILAPVDTGNLMNHIFAKTLKKETVSGATSAVGVVYTNVEYAIYQEYGWSRTYPSGKTVVYSGKAFMRPALQKNGELIDRMIEKYIQDKLKTIKK